MPLQTIGDVTYSAPEPVLNDETARALGRRILDLTSSRSSELQIVHTASGITRVSRNQVRSSTHGDTLTLRLVTSGIMSSGVLIDLNQLDDATVRAAIERLETVARQKGRSGRESSVGKPRGYGPQSYRSVHLWHDATADALGARRLSQVPAAVEAMHRVSMVGSMFIGAMARLTVIMDKSGLEAIARETDSEMTASVWTADGRGSGWAGMASRDWSLLDPRTVAEGAIDIARQSANPVAIEPGRYTTILSPDAVAQLVRMMAYAFNAKVTDSKMSPFSSTETRNRLGQHVLDTRISLESNPADPDGGYVPFFLGVGDPQAFPGLPLTSQRWIEDGILRNLAYDPGYAASRGRAPYNSTNGSFRMTCSGSLQSIEAMIAACDHGIYVNRLSGVEILDYYSGTMSGTTRDGCFLIRDGKITKPIKNLRFVDSPFLAFNRIEAVGATSRRALGYTPGAASWPLPPIIVPPLMIRDFNFAALADSI